MLMTPRQMLAFGEMYLRHGRLNDRQIVPRDWVDASIVARAQSTREWDRQYGTVGIRPLGRYRTHYAWGYGGQFIFVAPDLELVVVTTSSSELATTAARTPGRFTIWWNATLSSESPRICRRGASALGFDPRCGA